MKQLLEELCTESLLCFHTAKTLDQKGKFCLEDGNS